MSDPHDAWNGSIKQTIKKKKQNFLEESELIKNEQNHSHSRIFF